MIGGESVQLTDSHSLKSIEAEAVTASESSNGYLESKSIVPLLEKIQAGDDMTVLAMILRLIKANDKVEISSGIIQPEDPTPGYCIWCDQKCEGHYCVTCRAEFDDLARQDRERRKRELELE